MQQTCVGFLLIYCLFDIMVHARVEGVDLNYKRNVRFLHLNVYGRDKKECIERFKEIAKRIHAAKPAYDIITLNEHWNTIKFKGLACDGQLLTNLITSTGVYRDSDKAVRSLTHLPRSESSDWLIAANGGNSIFTKHSIIYDYSSVFVNSGRMPLMGSSLVRVKIDNQLTIDMWLTHLEANVDGCFDEDDCRLEQLDSVAANIDIFSSPSEGRKTTNPVLLVGDFNIGGPRNNYERLKHLNNPQNPEFKYKGNPGYEWIMEYFKEDTRDLWLEANKLNLPIGYTYDCLNNDLLTCKYQNRLDYFFVIGEEFFNAKPSFTTKLKSIQMLYNWKTQNGLPVSDHYGLDVTLEFGY